MEFLFVVTALLGILALPMSSATSQMKLRASSVPAGGSGVRNMMHIKKSFGPSTVDLKKRDDTIMKELNRRLAIQDKRLDELEQRLDKPDSEDKHRHKRKQLEQNQRGQDKRVRRAEIEASSKTQGKRGRQESSGRRQRGKDKREEGGKEEIEASSKTQGKRGRQESSGRRQRGEDKREEAGKEEIEASSKTQGKRGRQESSGRRQRGKDKQEEAGKEEREASTEREAKQESQESSERRQRGKGIQEEAGKEEREASTEREAKRESQESSTVTPEEVPEKRCMRPGKLTCTSQQGLTQEVTSVNDNGVAMAVSPSTASIWVISGSKLLNCFPGKPGENEEHSHANFPKPEPLCQKYAESYARENSQLFTGGDPSNLADGEGRYLKSCSVSEDKEWVAPADCNEQHQKGKDKQEEARKDLGRPSSRSRK